jgi:hypothetical protein
MQCRPVEVLDESSVLYRYCAMKSVHRRDDTGTVVSMVRRVQMGESLSRRATIKLDAQDPDVPRRTGRYKAFQESASLWDVYRIPFA